MNAQTQHNGGESSPTLTLAQINDMLNSAGFPIINPQKVQDLQRIAPRDRIVRAIRSAKSDTGARAYLNKIFEQAGIAVGSQGAVVDQTQAFEPEPQQPEQGYQQPDYDMPVPAHERNRSNGSQAQQRPRGGQGQMQGVGQDGNGGRLDPDERISVHVYGGKAALCFEADLTKGGVPTLALDAANSTGPRQYDWNNKIRLQLTRAELPVVAAVLIGALPACEFKNHGQDNNKGFSMERQQGGKIYIKVFAKDEGVRGVPVMPADVFYVTTLLIRQIRRACPWLDATSLMSLVRVTQANQ